MSDFEYKKAVECIIYLCSCAANATVPDPSRIKSVNLDYIFQVSEKHMLSAMVGQVLQSIGLSSPSFKKAIALAERKAVILNHEYINIVSVLEESGIWYMPIKGAVLQDYYPNFAMREMCDYDVLFDASRADDVKTIMEELGFITHEFGISSDDVYKKPPVSNFEMHRELFGSYQEEKLYEYYRDVKSRLIKADNKQYEYKFTPEDFYIYLIAHEYKHFSISGTGIRSLLDTYIYLCKSELNMDYVKVELEKLGILEFEQQNRSLSLALFEGEDLTDADSNMFEYILSSGTYGSIKNKVKNRIDSNSRSKSKYIVRRIWGPRRNDRDREHFEKTYSLFFKHKVLLPFLPFYRFIRAVSITPNRIKNEANAIRNTKCENK